jgi:hypothetical protein
MSEEEPKFANSFRVESTRSKPEYQQLSAINIQQVSDTDPDFATAMEIYDPEGELSHEQIEQRVRDELESKNWSLQPYWQEKGLPKEQINIELGNSKLEIFNFSNPLSDEQIETMKRVLSVLSQIKDGLILHDIDYILINNNENLDVKSGNPRNGVTSPNMRVIQLYPNALKSIPHRVAGVSNFEGTLIHEYGHVLQNDQEFNREWREKHGWRFLSEEEHKQIDDHAHLYANDEPEKCPTEYARFSPGEDICESLVEAIKSPDLLDPERLKTLQENWLKAIDYNPSVEVIANRKIADQISLPTIPEPLKYKVKIGRKLVVVKERRIKLGTPRPNTQE